MITFFALITGGCIGFIVGQYIHVNQRVVKVPAHMLYDETMLDRPPRRR